MIELQLGHSIKSLQSDWGGEFRSFSSFLKDNGILHRLICPHTHHQNGVIERKHCHVTETGLSMLAQASLPLKFWDDAFLLQHLSLIVYQLQFHLLLPIKFFLSASLITPSFEYSAALVFPFFIPTTNINLNIGLLNVSF